MSKIRTICPDCGSVELFPSEITVRICEDDGSATMRYGCPFCECSVTREIEHHIADLLAALRCPHEFWSTPIQLADLWPDKTSLTESDLRDFSMALGDEQAFQAALNGLENEGGDNS